MAIILVLEDENQIREDLCLLLEFEGFTARSAANGREGLSLIRAERPDLVLCDVLMPEMGGMELLQTLRSDPAYVDLPLVLLSAKSLPEDIRSGLDAGADAYVKKPYTSDHLLSVINRLLGTKAD